MRKPRRYDEPTVAVGALTPPPLLLLLPLILLLVVVGVSGKGTATSVIVILFERFSGVPKSFRSSFGWKITPMSREAAKALSLCASFFQKLNFVNYIRSATS